MCLYRQNHNNSGCGAVALKYKGYKLESSLAGHLNKNSVQCGGVHTGGENLF